MHKVKDIDGIHGEVDQVVLLGLEALFHFFVKRVGLALTTKEEVINKLISHGGSSGLKDEVGSILQHLLHLLFGQCLVLLRILLLLDHQTVPLQFNHLSLHNFLLHCVLGNQPVNIYHILLSYSVCSIHRLQVHLRVEITVINDHGVCCSEVDAEPSCTC